VYEWEVVGGVILGSNGSSEIEVVWDETREEGSIAYREYSLLDDFCEGSSPILVVAINSGIEASVLAMNDVSCFGGRDGNLEIRVQGGVPPYSFEWSHNADLDDIIADNLTIGNYSVTIKDSQGCEIKLEDLVISQPNLFEILSTEVSDVSCFGNTDGRAEIRLIGGTMPYSSNFQGVQIDDSSVRMEGLESGNYTISIFDANNCEIALEFFVNSPEPLEVLIEVIQNPCPGEENGLIRAEWLGGVGPFSYEWSNGQVTQEIDQVGAGDYEVNITDSQGCVSVGRLMVKEAAPVVRMPTGFDPSDGGFGPVSNCDIIDYKLSIYNKWGELIYHGNGPWDGISQGRETSLGVYAYRFEYVFQINGQLEKESLIGSFTKIK